MPEQTTDNAIADAALESVAAEVNVKPRKTGADQKVAELEEQLREANERALRSHAELENYRKRSQRELAEEQRYAVVPLVRDLLAVVDNLERAIEATYAGAQARPGNDKLAAGEDVSSLLSGVQLVAAQLESVLKQHQCVRIDTVGMPFDPNLHQAIAQEPSDQYPAGTITRATQAGYKLHDRVIRPAQVFVSTGPATR
jgi:molecular chaperone GrpE